MNITRVIRKDRKATTQSQQQKLSTSHQAFYDIVNLKQDLKNIDDEDFHCLYCDFKHQVTREMIIHCVLKHPDFIINYWQKNKLLSNKKPLDQFEKLQEKLKVQKVDQVQVEEESSQSDEEPAAQQQVNDEIPGIMDERFMPKNVPLRQEKKKKDLKDKRNKMIHSNQHDFVKQLAADSNDKSKSPVKPKSKSPTKQNKNQKEQESQKLGKRKSESDIHNVQLNKRVRCPSEPMEDSSSPLIDANQVDRDDFAERKAYENNRERKNSMANNDKRRNNSTSNTPNTSRQDESQSSNREKRPSDLSRKGRDSGSYKQDTLHEEQFENERWKYSARDNPKPFRHEIHSKIDCIPIGRPNKVDQNIKWKKCLICKNKIMPSQVNQHCIKEHKTSSSTMCGNCPLGKYLGDKEAIKKHHANKHAAREIEITSFIVQEVEETPTQVKGKVKSKSEDTVIPLRNVTRKNSAQKKESKLDKISKTIYLGPLKNQKTKKAQKSNATRRASSNDEEECSDELFVTQPSTFSTMKIPSIKDEVIDPSEYENQSFEQYYEEQSCQQNESNDETEQVNENSEVEENENESNEIADKDESPQSEEITIIERAKEEIECITLDD